MKLIWRVSRYLFRYPGLFWATQGFAVLMTLLAIAVPKVIEWILEDLQSGLTTGTIVFWGGVMALLYLGSEVCNGLRIVVNNWLEQRVLLDMRRDLHTKLLRLPFGFFDRHKSGELASCVIEDVTNLERALLDGTELGGRAVVMLIGVTAVLFATNATLAWVVFLPIPIMLVSGYFYAKGSRRFWKKVRVASASLNGLLVEDIQGNRLIQSFGLAPREKARFETRAQELRRRTLRAMYRWAAYSPVTGLLSSLGTVAVIAVGGWLIMTGQGNFQFPQLAAFLLYVRMLYEPVGQLHQINHLLAQGRAAGERVFELLDAKEDIEETAAPVPLPDGPATLRYEHVSFAYPGRPGTLEDFSLELPAGKVTALVGHTGAGKTTVANLAMRAYDVTGGRITYNGVDLREAALYDLQQRIGHVAQDPFLFEGSVRDNLLLAREAAGEADLQAALEGACAWDFVQRLPEGLDTNIGEKGIRLSQGEKQRLTIARVLLRNPPFVILDEATASVDTLTERQIQTALDRLMQDRTVLVIAHRLSTVCKADQILVLEQGRIREQGTHAQLLAKGGMYAALWQVQQDSIEGHLAEVDAPEGWSDSADANRHLSPL